MPHLYDGISSSIPYWLHVLGLSEPVFPTIKYGKQYLLHGLVMRFLKDGV